MTGLEGLGKLLLIMGVVIALLGLGLLLAPRLPLLGRLPGDIVIKKDGFSLYFPVVTFLLLSLILTLMVNLFLRFWGR